MAKIDFNTRQQRNGSNFLIPSGDVIFLRKFQNVRRFFTSYNKRTMKNFWSLLMIRVFITSQTKFLSDSEPKRFRKN